MKKRIPIYHFVLAGVMILSLFLPYTQWNGGDRICALCNTQTVTPTPAYALSGFHHIHYTVLPILGMMSISVITLAVRNRFTAIVSVVLSVILVLSIPVEMVGIFGLSQLTVGIGFILSVFAIFSFLGFNIANLIWIRKNVGRRATSRTSVHILDTDFI